MTNEDDRKLAVITNAIGYELAVANGVEPKKTQSPMKAIVYPTHQDLKLARRIAERVVFDLEEWERREAWMSSRS